MTRTARLALKIGIPILILAGAGGLTAKLIASREEPEREEAEQQAVLVETAKVERAEHRLDVRANGTVVPARQVVLQPQVSGRVVEIDADLVPGGIVKEGERLVQIDRSDYEIALEQRQTALAQARAQLEIEKGQQQIAEREWKLFKEQAEKLSAIDDPSLALRRPQLNSAKAQVDSAKSQVKAAKLNLERTSVEAPFDAFVRSENVEVGQLAGQQSQLATLVSTDAFWIRLSVPTNKIPYIDIPGVNAEKGSEATVRYRAGENKIDREARVIRLLGDLDPAGRMARVLVEIDDPFAIEEMADNGRKNRGLPLLLDAYVDVRIEGNRKKELIEVPRRAVRNGDQVYVVRDGKLAIETVEIAWRRPKTLLVASGIDDGATVVVGLLPQPVEGMLLKSEPSAGATESTGTSGGGEAGSSGGEADAVPVEDSSEGSGAESTEEPAERGSSQ